MEAGGKTSASSLLKNWIGKPPSEPTANYSREFAKLSRDHNILLLLISCVNHKHFQALAVSICFPSFSLGPSALCWLDICQGHGTLLHSCLHHCWPMRSRWLLSVKDARGFLLASCNIKNIVAWTPSQGEQAELHSAQRKSLFPWRGSQQLLLCV